jgi:hypothetical protein
MKETIISISKPIPKVQPKPIEDDPQSEISLTAEINLLEELQQPEPIDLSQPASMTFTNTSGSGWKVSDILREIRLDRFEIDDMDDYENVL